MHTPGPWYANFNSAGYYDISIGPDYHSQSVGSVHKNPFIEGDAAANARLAAAAPDLLVAVQRCLNFIEGTEAEFGEEFECGNIARAALAKAGAA